MRGSILASSLALLFGCSDFTCPEGGARVDGMCPDTGGGIVNPDVKTKIIQLGCSNNQTAGVSLLPWELTVDPGPIVAGVEFGATFSARAHFPLPFLYAAQRLPGGVSRVNLRELQATVHVRRGVSAGDDVMLRFAPIPRTCRYDEQGNAEFGAGPFPGCAPANDNPDGSNEDCVGLGGKADPANPCGRFVDIRVSDDCGPGGVCESLGDPFPQTPSPIEQCDANGFCVEDVVELELTGETDGYIAADEGHVLFGWDDVSVGVEIDRTGGPNDGVWLLPEAVFEDDPGPNGMRWIAGETEIAIECAMAVGSFGAFGVASRDNLTSPAPDHVLISFPIQEL